MSWKVAQGAGFDLATQDLPILEAVSPILGKLHTASCTAHCLAPPLQAMPLLGGTAVPRK